MTEKLDPVEFLVSYLKAKAQYGWLSANIDKVKELDLPEKVKSKLYSYFLDKINRNKLTAYFKEDVKYFLEEFLPQLDEELANKVKARFFSFADAILSAFKVFKIYQNGDLRVETKHFAKTISRKDLKKFIEGKKTRQGLEQVPFLGFTEIMQIALTEGITTDLEEIENNIYEINMRILEKYVDMLKKKEVLPFENEKEELAVALFKELILRQAFVVEIPEDHSIDEVARVLEKVGEVELDEGVEYLPPFESIILIQRGDVMFPTRLLWEMVRFKTPFLRFLERNKVARIVFDKYIRIGTLTKKKIRYLIIKEKDLQRVFQIKREHFGKLIPKDVIRNLIENEHKFEGGGEDGGIVEYNVGS